MSDELLYQISTAVVSLNAEETEQLTQQALDAGIEPEKIINEGLLRGLLEVGDKWERQEYFISHVLMGARAMQMGVDLVEPHLVGETREPLGRIVIGTVEGDVHDIGKNLVTLMLRTAGYEVHDLGVDVPPQTFIDKAKEIDADIVASSLIMSICLPKMEEINKLADQEGLRPRVKTVVGGPPLSDKVAERIGADAYGGDDAVAGVRTINRLLGIEERVPYV
jgi:corrinoid protein of di/trimethylamine methyltransferase